jgi:ribosome maturation factor RimP
VNGEPEKEIYFAVYHIIIIFALIFRDRGHQSPLFYYRYCMIDARFIRELLRKELELRGLFLVDLAIRPGNRILVYIDSMKGVTIEECTAVSRFIESKLDRDSEDFELEVSSPGLDKPLKLPVQFHKNVGRGLEVVTKDGLKTTGKLVAVNEDTLTLEVEVTEKDAVSGKKKKVIKSREIVFDHIKTAKVAVSFKK